MFNVERDFEILENNLDTLAGVLSDRLIKHRHKTKDGVAMPIAAMSDQHLLNTVRVFARSLRSYAETARVGNGIDDFQRLIYDVERVDAADVAIRIRSFLVLIAPYVLELYIRGNLEFRDELIELLQRDSQLQANYPSLSEGSSEEESSSPF